MVRFVLVLGTAILATSVVTGCSLKVPSYNPVLGGFPMPTEYIGESMPKTVALDIDSKHESRARPKVQSTSMR